MMKLIYLHFDQTCYYESTIETNEINIVILEMIPYQLHYIDLHWMYLQFSISKVHPVHSIAKPGLLYCIYLHNIDEKKSLTHFKFHKMTIHWSITLIIQYLFLLEIYLFIAFASGPLCICIQRKRSDQFSIYCQQSF